MPFQWSFWSENFHHVTWNIIEFLHKCQSNSLNVLNISFQRKWNTSYVLCIYFISLIVSRIIKQTSHYAYIPKFLQSTEPWSPITNKTWRIHVSFIYYYLCTFPALSAWIIGAYHVYCYFLVPPNYFAFTKPIQKHLVLLTPDVHIVCFTGLIHFFSFNVWSLLLAVSTITS